MSEKHRGLLNRSFIYLFFHGKYKLWLSCSEQLESLVLLKLNSVDTSFSVDFVFLFVKAMVINCIGFFFPLLKASDKSDENTIISSLCTLCSPS